MQKIKATRSDLIVMLGALPAVNNLKGFKLAYAVAKNKIALQAEQKILNEILKSSDQFLAYEKDRIKLCEKFADKDDAGKPIIVGNKYQGVNVNPEFQKAWAELKEIYKEAIEVEQNKNAEYLKALEEEIEFDMEMIPINELPQDISVAQMDALMLMTSDHDGMMQKEEKPAEKPENEGAE